METSSTDTQRRTQEERSATTRAALRAATIECLVENGYRATSTAEIAERAGVSRGARSHHYSTKHDLVTDAIQHLYRGLTETYEREFARLSGVDREAAAFRLLWSMFLDRRHAAVLELYVAARTDPELRASLHEVAARHHANILRLARTYFPAFAAREPAFDSLIDLIVVTLLGAALRRAVFGEDESERKLLALLEDVLGERLLGRPNR